MKQTCAPEPPVRGEDVTELLSIDEFTHSYKLLERHHKHYVTEWGGAEGYAASLKVCACLHALTQQVLCSLPAEDVRILELGSGISTFAIGLALEEEEEKSVRNSFLDSFDGDPIWAQRTESFIEDRGYFSQTVSSLEHFAGGDPYHMAFLDVGGLDRRIELLPKVWDRLAAGGYLVLDDMHKHAYATQAWAFIHGRPHVRWDVYELTLDRYLRHAWLVQKPRP